VEGDLKMKTEKYIVNGRGISRENGIFEDWGIEAEAVCRVLGMPQHGSMEVKLAEEMGESDTIFIKNSLSPGEAEGRMFEFHKNLLEQSCMIGGRTQMSVTDSYRKMYSPA
jgi:hypothetical protein